MIGHLNTNWPEKRDVAVYVHFVSYHTNHVYHFPSQLKISNQKQFNMVDILSRQNKTLPTIQENHAYMWFGKHKPNSCNKIHTCVHESSMTSWELTQCTCFSKN